ncbi:MAG: hypothetical protein A2W98_04110 [Bacteroidetes bacterium GWF2_33_38]|nr:MAG: hypothetical protein A2W98_04110 [Bacteroidetes bacterium GWF2_33_38]OFY76077.1 MAG: hypothetical protein A2265_05890 [Bacteroidetes bacterium RIFOXYA12_FULL_33_9]
MNKSKLYIFLFLLQLSFVGCSQNYDTLTYDLSKFDFIRLSQNRFLFAENNTSLTSFFKNLNQIINNKSQKISILHIGDSHIQGNLFTNRIRKNISRVFKLEVGRGIMFPYSIAGTNDCYDYSTVFTGNWQKCRNIESDKDCKLGLTGYSVTTQDNLAAFYFKYRNDSLAFSEDFKLRLWYKKNENYTATVEGKPSIHVNELANDLCIAEYKVTGINKDSICVKFSRTTNQANTFTLYGFEIINDNEMIDYHSVGVNGADVTAWNNSSQLISQIEIIQANLIIISLGANDGYKKMFDEKLFFDSYNQFIEKIRTSFPNVAILLTTPGDSYQYKKQVNPNNEKIRNITIALAKKHDCVVWDFYEIMGGLNSIKKWNENGLSSSDLLHLSPTGYLLQGDLFFQAFMSEFEKY